MVTWRFSFPLRFGFFSFLFFLFFAVRPRPGPKAGSKGGNCAKESGGFQEPRCAFSGLTNQHLLASPPANNPLTPTLTTRIEEGKDLGAGKGLEIVCDGTIRSDLAYVLVNKVEI